MLRIWTRLRCAVGWHDWIPWAVRIYPTGMQVINGYRCLNCTKAKAA